MCRVSSSPPPIDCRVRVRSQSQESVKGHSRVVAAAVERVRRVRGVPGARARRLGGWGGGRAVHGLFSSRGRGRRAERAREVRSRSRADARTGVVRARRTLILWRTALFDVAFANTSRSAIGAPGAVGKGHAPTRRACFSARGSGRTTLRVAGDSLRARRRGRMAASAGGEGKRTIDRCASFRTYLTLKSLD